MEQTKSATRKLLKDGQILQVVAHSIGGLPTTLNHVQRQIVGSRRHLSGCNCKQL